MQPLHNRYEPLLYNIICIAHLQLSVLSHEIIIKPFSVELQAKMLSSQNDCNESSIDFTVKTTLAVEISAVLFAPVSDTLYLIIPVDPQNGLLCDIIEAAEFYPSMVEFLFIISINCFLLYKVYTSVRTSCYHCHGSSLYSWQCIFSSHSLLSQFYWGLRGNQFIAWPYHCECHIANMSGEDCNRRYVVQSQFKIIPEYIPVAIEILLSILCIYTLSIWWYWLLRNSYENHLEGNGTVAIHLSSYCIYAIT